MRPAPRRQVAGEKRAVARAVRAMVWCANSCRDCRACRAAATPSGGCAASQSESSQRSMLRATGAKLRQLRVAARPLTMTVAMASGCDMLGTPPAPARAALSIASSRCRGSRAAGHAANIPPRWSAACGCCRCVAEAIDEVVLGGTQFGVGRPVCTYCFRISRTSRCASSVFSFLVWSVMPHGLRAASPAAIAVLALGSALASRAHWSVNRELNPPPPST